MRISDWSSDVCSSDLAVILQLLQDHRGLEHRQHAVEAKIRHIETGCLDVGIDDLATCHEARLCGRHLLQRMHHRRVIGLRPPGQQGRSEEHTSELQSLMRISYAVFCLKKKNKKEKNTT